MPKLELELNCRHSTHPSSPTRAQKVLESPPSLWALHKKVHVCMCVCIQLPRADCLLRFSIKNASKWLDYPVVVYRRAVPVFCRCCHLTGRWPPALKAEKHGLIEESLTGAVFESVARHTVHPATNAIGPKDLINVHMVSLCPGLHRVSIWIPLP